MSSEEAHRALAEAEKAAASLGREIKRARDLVKQARERLETQGRRARQERTSK